MMGFIGLKDTQLTISSRFYPNGDDYFLHYMLQKVFSINLVDLKLKNEPEKIWDFLLIYLFPYYLKKAINQGLYKEYVTNKYNDANIKGAIDINRHIRENLPFRGTVSYSTREHTIDNRMTQLIRHTQEFIRNNSRYSSVLSCDKETKAIVSMVDFNTPSYNRLKRTKVIQDNIKIINHPFYTEYEVLRKICLQILRREGLTYGKKNDNKVHGIVFDGAWLWEEYLNTILKELNFIHPENKTRKNGISLFKENRSLRFPDFYSKEKAIVLDAKYKYFEKWNPNNENNADVYQLITYLHCLNSKIGSFIFPLEETDSAIVHHDKIGDLLGYGGILYKTCLVIPNKATTFSDFIKVIKDKEDLFKNIISNLS